MFWLEGRAGDVPGPYHAVNLLLHVIGVLLLWAVLRKLSCRPCGGWR